MSLAISFSLLIQLFACSEVWRWSWYPRRSPLWPRWLIRQCEMKQTIDRCYRVPHDNTAEGRYGKALASHTLASVFQTDYSNWSIFQVINVAWNSAWRARKRWNTLSGASLPLCSPSEFKCASCCSDNSIRDLLKPCEISPHACVWSQLIVRHQMRWVRKEKKL